MESRSIKLYVFMIHQDDPKKCTASKLVRFKLAQPIKRMRQIPPSAVVLNPYSKQLLTPLDRDLVSRFGLVAVDCSWERADAVFASRMRGLHRRLPSLLPGNPVSYGRLSRLSSLEAFAAALYIVSCSNQADSLLSLYKWGSTFQTLNAEPLEGYRRSGSEEEALKVESEFFA